MFAARYMRMGAKIRYYRTLRGLDQVSLAENLGITSQYLSKIERGVAKPSTDLLFLIAEKLDVDIVQIMRSDDL